MKWGWRQKLITLVGALGMGLIFSFLIAETVLRLRTPPISRLQNDRIVLPVHAAYTYPSRGLRGTDAQIVHHKNSFGFRGAEPPEHFEDFLTLVAVGGSTTECFYLSDGKSWPERLGERLERSFDKVWVNNAGLDGHSTFGHLILLQDILARIHPKIVLFLVGINDVGRDDLTADPNSLPPAWKKLMAKSRVMPWLQNIYRAGKAWKRGLSHASVDVSTLPLLNVSGPQAQAILEPHQRTYAAAYQNRLQTLVQTAQAQGMYPVLITQPVLYGEGRDETTGADLENMQVTPQMNGLLAWKVLELYNDVTRQVARENRVPLIDLARVLKKSSAYFYDFYHFTNQGADAAAEIIFAQLRPVLLGKYPSFKKPDEQAGNR
jgi:lysophospholipase L1-like esterase